MSWMLPAAPIYCTSMGWMEDKMDRGRMFFFFKDGCAPSGTGDWVVQNKIAPLHYFSSRRYCLCRALSLLLYVSGGVDQRKSLRLQCPLLYTLESVSTVDTKNPKQARPFPFLLPYLLFWSSHGETVKFYMRGRRARARPDSLSESAPPRIEIAFHPDTRT